MKEYGRPVAINVRSLVSQTTGVQRYTLEILGRLQKLLVPMAPSGGKSGLKGHAWEQFVLPCRLGDRLLFSPANTGPLAIKRQVLTVHDVAALDHPERLSPKFAAWYRFLTPRLIQRVERVITVSDYSKQRVLAHVELDDSRISVIPNGVDERFAPQGKEAVTAVRWALHIPRDRYLLSVGTLEPRKNLPRLLRAWAKVVDKLPDDVCLVLAGKEDTRLFARVPGLNGLPPRVHITGHVPDELLPPLYSGALAFAFPSLYEGFGLPPLEAMASGVPVLAGNVTSIPEVVGDAGLLVDPYSVDEIAEGLLTLIDDEPLRARLIAKGLERAKQFTWEATAHRTWAVLQEVAGA